MLWQKHENSKEMALNMMLLTTRCRFESCPRIGYLSELKTKYASFLAGNLVDWIECRFYPISRIFGVIFIRSRFNSLEQIHRLRVFVINHIFFFWTKGYRGEILVEKRPVNNLFEMGVSILHPGVAMRWQGPICGFTGNTNPGEMKNFFPLRLKWDTRQRFEVQETKGIVKKSNSRHKKNDL